MKILNLVFHPDLNSSRVNRRWKAQLEVSGKITTSRDMYAEYPDFQIDVDKEQKLLLDHDRIVFQFPIYWWSMPPLLKKWLDDVLQYQFAYGSKGDKLKGKDMQIICSAGGQAKNYNGFHMFATVPEVLKPFQLTANLAQMNYAQPLYMFNADACPDDEIRLFGDKWAEVIDDPRRGDGLEFTNQRIHEELIDVYQHLGMA
ncbi:MAG: NAD(P)H-dependent oxidoreductase [Candidatus Thiodiazotropha taylori]|nr:NAD(P)H-dependent oxidoreductase [Candidatus Thiodiazotropha endolucinida]MCW4228896.1 NAD(P)H-dependent oxidoreductase [Candidatus Thiodiazotropha taylori]